ncbi:hypothetical protein M3568_19695 [Priestia flexa]|uniref:hypothetical protein n=1 Tax=Priestia flexa TaxID=86664 RepID=UPI001EF664E4|nr:hypothetical protein [Priestia flexa]MCG7315250.1 hypothetical protein [Priestia flexa]MCM3068537.1 hypothetical protein [Priestia flexa]
MPLLRDIQLLVPNNKDVNSQFFSETRCMVSFYNRLLPRIKLKEDKGIVINCVNSLQEIASTDSDSYIIFNYIPVFVEIDIDNFFLLPTNQEKKKYTLDILNRGMIKFAEQHNYDKEVFENVYNKIIELNYNNTHIFNKKVSPNRKYTCAVIYEHDVDYIDVYLEIIRNNKKGIINRERIFRYKDNDEQDLLSEFGEIVWTLNHKVTFSGFYNNERYIITFIEERENRPLYWKLEKQSL